MAVELRLCALLALFAASSCVSTTYAPPSERSAALAAEDTSARDGALAAAGRAQAFGAAPALARWVERQPGEALVILASDLGGALVDAIGEAYDERCGGPPASERKSIAVLRDVGAHAHEHQLAVLDTLPASKPSHFVFALALALAQDDARRGAVDAAHAAWKRAIAAGTSWRDATRIELALALCPAGEETVQADLLARLCDLDPARGLARAEASGAHGATLDLARARALHTLGRSDEAFAAARQSGLPGARALSGVILAERGELDGARTLLEGALVPDDTWRGAARAAADLGVVLLRQAHESEGLDQFKRACDLARRDGDAASELSTLHNCAAWLRSVKRD